MILLFDIGNTRIKWATLTERGLSTQSAHIYSDWDSARFTEVVLDPIPRPDRILVSNVAGEVAAGLLRNAVASKWGIKTQFVTATAEACGVRNAYSQPANLGVDRWLSLIAVHGLRPGLACIVSVGTAMTIDAIDASGRHLGGIIVPGPDLMVSSLLHNTSDIAQRAEQGNTSDTLLADNTLGAIHQGAAHALAALVERTIESLRPPAGSQPALILSGGSAAVIGRLLHARYEKIPDLVLRGLARWESYHSER